jgi:hypothetical protein
VICFTSEKKKRSKIFSLVYRIHLSLDKKEKERNEMDSRNSHDTLFSHIDSAKVKYYSNKSKIVEKKTKGVEPF